MRYRTAPERDLFATMLGVILCGVVLIGCATPNVSSTGATSSTGHPRATTIVTTAVLPTRVPSKTPAHGVGFMLFIHCGITYLTYHGDSYQAEHSEDVPVRLAGPGGMARESGYVHGYLAIGGRMAVFTVTDPTTSVDGQVITFRLLPASAGPMPLCA